MIAGRINKQGRPWSVSGLKVQQSQFDQVLLSEYYVKYGKPVKPSILVNTVITNMS